MEAGPEVELVTTGVATGGEAVARGDDGRVVFVRGALSGERVRVSLVDERRSFARAELVSVLESSPDRREPPCPHVAGGCGGCDWQHADPPAQATMRRSIVEDALARLGRIPEPVVRAAESLPAEGYRTSVRGLAVDGRFAFRHRASHDPVPVDACLVAHPLVDELVRESDFGVAREVTIRAGARTGERLVLAAPTAEGVRVPDDVLVVGADELRRGRRAWFHEEVAGRTWRVSATSFFQARPDGAEQLVELVRAGLGEGLAGDEPVVDLCSGVGLFAGTVVPDGATVLAVERAASAVADARHNLGDQRVRHVRSAMERWTPARASALVADPPRSGLAKAGVDVVAATRAPVVVLISCDPASLGRDAGLLVAAGYRHDVSTLVDLFPQTSHVEVVSRFSR